MTILPFTTEQPSTIISDPNNPFKESNAAILIASNQQSFTTETVPLAEQSSSLRNKISSASQASEETVTTTESTEQLNAELEEEPELKIYEKKSLEDATIQPNFLFELVNHEDQSSSSLNEPSIVSGFQRRP